jgi:hypothetical protein
METEPPIKVILNKKFKKKNGWTDILGGNLILMFHFYLCCRWFVALSQLFARKSMTLRHIWTQAAVWTDLCDTNVLMFYSYWDRTGIDLEF